MPDDPLADLKGHHPQTLDLSGIKDRAFTFEERDEILRAAREANTTSEWLASVAKIVGTLAKASL